MIIRFGELESDQPSLKGRVEADIFQLENDGVICSTGPIDCELSTLASGDHLIVDGTLSIPLQLRCVGCLEEFPYLHEMADYHAEIELADHNGTLDLTDYIRDDILLDVPNYPRCSDGGQPGRICPLEGPFSFESPGKNPSSGSSAKPPGANVWDALENLDTGDH
jgi:uncharacterized metal-binding protein YceD (DUF177 family)